MSRSKCENLWAGQFGTEYTARNEVPFLERIGFWQRHLPWDVGSICELGANRGANLRAIQAARRCCTPDTMVGLEINPCAAGALGKIDGVDARESSILEFDPGRKYDMVFTMGVLIHVPPEDLDATYQKVFDLSAKYILVAEYFSDKPRGVWYHGEWERLWARDFAGEMLDKFPDDLSVLDHGFLWKRVTPAFDNLTWTLMRKRCHTNT